MCTLLDVIVYFDTRVENMEQANAALIKQCTNVQRRQKTDYFECLVDDKLRLQCVNIIYGADKDGHINRYTMLNAGTLAGAGRLIRMAHLPCRIQSCLWHVILWMRNTINKTAKTRRIVVQQEILLRLCKVVGFTQTMLS